MTSSSPLGVSSGPGSVPSVVGVSVGASVGLGSSPPQAANIVKRNIASKIAASRLLMPCILYITQPNLPSEGIPFIICIFGCRSARKPHILDRQNGLRHIRAYRHVYIIPRVSAFCNTYPKKFLSTKKKTRATMKNARILYKTLDKQTHFYNNPCPVPTRLKYSLLFSSFSLFFLTARGRCAIIYAGNGNASLLPSPTLHPL